MEKNDTSRTNNNKYKNVFIWLIFLFIIFCLIWEAFVNDMKAAKILMGIIWVFFCFIVISSRR